MASTCTHRYVCIPSLQLFRTTTDRNCPYTSILPTSISAPVCLSRHVIPQSGHCPLMDATVVNP